MSAYELTQESYEAVMGNNPSTFSGENLPVENISWLDAVNYCNVRSEQEGLTPVYIIDGDTDSGNPSVSNEPRVLWNRGADGYRLPTEAGNLKVYRGGGWNDFAKNMRIRKSEKQSLTLAWNSDGWTFDALEAHYQTLVRYLNLADCGRILGKGCGSPAMTRRSKYPEKAYDLGRSLS